MGVSAVVAVGLALVQDKRQHEAQGRVRRVRKLQQRRDAIKATRTRAAGIREARIKRGTAVAQAANTGTATSSGLFGQTGALSTGAAGQQGFFNASEQISARANSAFEGAARASSSAATYGALSNIFSQNAQRIDGLFKE